MLKAIFSLYSLTYLQSLNRCCYIWAFLRTFWKAQTPKIRKTYFIGRFCVVNSQNQELEDRIASHADQTLGHPSDLYLWYGFCERREPTQAVLLYEKTDENALNYSICTDMCICTYAVKEHQISLLCLLPIVLEHWNSLFMKKKFSCAWKSIRYRTR